MTGEPQRDTVLVEQVRTRQLQRSFELQELVLANETRWLLFQFRNDDSREGVDDVLDSGGCARRTTAEERSKLLQNVVENVAHALATGTKQPLELYRNSCTLPAEKLIEIKVKVLMQSRWGIESCSRRRRCGAGLASGANVKSANGTMQYTLGAWLQVC